MNKLPRYFAWLFSLLLIIAATGCQSTSVGTKIDDSVITTKVKTALFADPDVSGLQVKVETVAGEVQLSGFVPTQAQAQRAVELARRVEGVDKVLNKMTVRP